MFKRVAVIMVLVTFGFFFWGYAEGELTNPIEAGSLMVDASSTATEDWTYFSFSMGDTIRPADPENSMDWDLKFQRYRIGTNSGTSGPGEGGAVNVGKVDFDSYAEAPESGYIEDTIMTFAGHAGEYERSCNPVLLGWFEMVGMPPTFYPTDTVYVVKTADGKYAKVMFLDYYYYDAEGNRHSGYITFKYAYQTDGSRNFVGIEEIVDNDFRKTASLKVSPIPAMASVDVHYSIPSETHITLKVYDIQGRLIRTLFQGYEKPGFYSKKWDRCDKGSSKVAEGIYFIQMLTGYSKSTVKTIVVK